MSSVFIRELFILEIVNRLFCLVETMPKIHCRRSQAKFLMDKRFRVGIISRAPRPFDSVPHLGRDSAQGNGNGVIVPLLNRLSISYKGIPKK